LRTAEPQPRVLRTRRILVCLLVAATVACAGKGKTKPETDPPAKVYQMAMEKMAKKRYFAARNLLQGLLPKLPPEDRDLLPRVQIAIADSYYKDGGLLNYGEALNGYRNFLSYFPQHEEADRAQFMIGMSLFKQVLAPDRDQVLTLKAIDEFRRVESAFPFGRFVEEARGQITKCFDLLAEHERIIGYFYQRRKQWNAAIDRYRYVVDRYPRYKEMNRLLFDLGRCQLAVGDRAGAEEVINRLVREDTAGKLAERAKRALGEYDRKHNRSATASVPAAEAR
jgi:outer membrane protein assembly factor BamD